MEIRIEYFSSGKVVHMPLAQAITEIGKDQLNEYLQGYSSDAAFFLEDTEGQTLYAENYVKYFNVK